MSFSEGSYYFFFWYHVLVELWRKINNTQQKNAQVRWICHPVSYWFGSLLSVQSDGRDNCSHVWLVLLHSQQAYAHACHDLLVYIMHSVISNRFLGRPVYFIYTIMPCPSLALASSNVHTSTCYRIRHRSFIFGIHMHLGPSYMHMKNWVILSCSF